MFLVDFERGKTTKYSFVTLAKGLASSSTYFISSKKESVTKKITKIIRIGAR